MHVMMSYDLNVHECVGWTCNSPPLTTRTDDHIITVVLLLDNIASMLYSVVYCML